jgi:aldehyde:ferredoxin oxidoreductase
MIKGGYVGQLLRVDLSKKKIFIEKLPPENILRKWIGAQGLSIKILYDEVPPDVHPLDPKNRIIFMTGPLTGTIAPSSSRTWVTGLRPTVLTSGTATGGGYFGPNLKFAGFDGIIIQGASEKPVYLWIHEGNAEIRDATKVWGHDTEESEDLVIEDLQDPDASVLTIGPVAENGVYESALITMSKNHIACKSGQGSIMGFKKLKAIAVSGRKASIKLADAKKAVELAIEQRKVFMESENVQVVEKGGFVRHCSEYATYCGTMVKNYTDPMFAVPFTKGITDTLEHAEFQKIRPCFNCSIGCASNIKFGSGKFKGRVVTHGGGGENNEGIGGNVGVTEEGMSIVLTDTADRLGMDAADAGETLGLAYECYEAGILTKDKTDGLELTWGNGDAAIELLHKMARREGFGKVLAAGIKETAEYIGGDAIKRAIHIKGMGSGAHDIRPSWELQLSQIISTAGPIWQGMGVDQYAGEPDFGYPKIAPRYDRERCAPIIRKTQNKKQFEDTVGTCQFTQFGVKGAINYYLPKMIKYVIGWDFTTEEGLLVGERITNLQRLFELRRGLKPEDTFDIGERFMEAPNVGPAKGNSIKPIIKDLVREYYREMGWDENTGIPLKETFKKLDLSEYLHDLEKIRQQYKK